MSDVKYIAECGEFIVDGRVIKESTLTDEEKKVLMEQCKEVQFIIGGNDEEQSGQLIL